jgi:hypothetical protein
MAYDEYDDYDDADYRRRSDDWPHSGVGIASFIAGILALVMIASGFVLAAISATQPHRYGGPPPAAVFGGMLILFAALVALIGTGLGIGGVCQGQRRKVFGIIGLCLNGLILLGGIGLVVIGLAVSASIG